MLEASESLTATESSQGSFFPVGSSRKELRPHQVRALDMLRASLRQGNRRVIIQAPTGAGKTVLAAKILEGALAKGNRAIFTAPMINLIDQTVAAFEAEGIRDVGVMQANHPRSNGLARVQVASVQTLARRAIPSAALVIVDEAHIRSEVIDKLMDARPDVFFVGLTATPWAKGMGLRWQDLVVPCTVRELVEAGYLSHSRVFAPDVPNLAGVKTVAGDYAEAQLEDVMGGAAIMGSVVETWLSRGEARPTLAFGVNRSHAQAMHEAFERAGIASAYVDGTSDRIERGVIGRRFRDGEIRVICSVRTMTTGVDLPVSCIIDAAPTKSAILHMQKIGRGLRINPGTEDLLVLDHAGNALRLGLVEDLHQAKLDMTKPGEKQERPAAAEKLPKPCGRCETLFTGKTCPACGHVRVFTSNVESAAGELVEITTGKKATVSLAAREARLAGLLWIARERGYKSGWAARKYQEWHGCWPANGMHPEPIPPTLEVSNYVKAAQIRWAKSQQGKVSS